MSTLVDETQTSAVDAALAERPVLLAEIHRPLLHDFARRLGTLLDAGSGRGLALDRERLLVTCTGDLLEELSGLAGRTLVADFHDRRRRLGLPPDPGSSTAFTTYAEHVRTPGAYDELRTAHPVLADLLDRAVANRLVLLEELLGAAAADRDALTVLGLLPEGPLTGVRVSSGDAHNGGRRVAIVHRGEHRVVYKPRPLAVDDAVAEIVGLLNAHLEPGCELRVPRTLVRPGHGWQEHVSPAPMTDFDQVGRQRYRLGAFLAIFASIGSTDLHHENVIAAGEHPMFVDLETALQHQAEPEDPESGLAQTLSSPLLSTMLLPMRIAGHPLDVDMSGIGTASSQTCSMASFSILDPGTDAMRFERASFEVRHSDNLAHLGDVAVPTGAHADDLVLGFTHAVEAIRAERDEVLARLRRTPLTVRQVVRPTHVYARFLSASTHPRYLTDPAERARLLRRLAPPAGIAAAARESLAALETTALLRHDVPYFQASLTGTDLHAPLDGTAVGAYSRPLVDRLTASLDRFLAAPARQHEHTIRMCLATACEQPALAAVDSRPAAGGYAADLVAAGPASVADGVAGLLLETALEAGPRGQVAWLTPSAEARADGRSGVVFRPGDVSVYEGGGIALLLAAQARATGRADLADLARAAVPDDLALPDLHTRSGLSVFSGQAGAVSLFHELGTLLDDDALLGRRDELLAGLLSAEITEEHEVDVVGGYSASAAYVAALAVPGSEDFLARAVEGMRTALRSGGLAPGELAHGDLGVAWCLARVAAAVDHEQGLADAGRVLACHVAHGEAAAPLRPSYLAHAAWCKGTAGSLIALAEGLPLTGWLPAEVDEVVDRLAARARREVTGRGRDVSPCHGATGPVQALARVADLRGRPELRAEAREMYDARRAQVARDGYTGGLSGSQGYLGYMLGLTGVAHTELLLDHPTWGSPLTLTPTRPERSPR